MEQLHPVIFLAVLGSFVSGPSIAYAEDACSLRVRVLSPDGQRPEAPVEVIEASGRAEDKEQGNSDVEFCDLGILPVTVKVGSSGLCNGVTVRDVPVSWDQTYLLTVTYDPSACAIWHRPPPPVAACEFLLRITDSNGRWIPGAPVTFPDPQLGEMKADQFGRVWFVIRANKDLHGSVAAVGFRPAEFVCKCAPSERSREQYVKLEKQ
jgi:hypothetical protein